MSSYFTKKKLIDDNSDLYISEYDKSLPSKDLEGIISAKRSYNEAQKTGNTYAMQEANKRANDIRKTSGSYTGGLDGSEYKRTPKDYEIRVYEGFSSPYSKEKKRVLSKINSMNDFSYNPEDDPIYAIYANLYRSLGEDAYDRALSQNAMRTGGVASTSAQSLAMQAQNKYNSMLTAKIPELYAQAYDKYLNEYERLYRELEMYEDFENTEYKRYRDRVSDWENDRDYQSKRDKETRDELWNQYEFNSNLEYDLAKDEEEMSFKKERADMEDAKWGMEFDQKSYMDALNATMDLVKIIVDEPDISAALIQELYDSLKLD